MPGRNEKRAPICLMICLGVARLDRTFRYLDPEDVATIMYTSGTTGLPKGAMMTHRNIFTNARNCGAMLTYTEKDITLIVVPLFHVTGLNSQLVAFIYIGGTCVIMKAYKTAEMIQAIERHKITVLFNVPTMYVLMLINEALAEYGVGFRADGGLRRGPDG